MKSNEKTSLLSNGLLWFGAAVSIAEILTGTFFAPLGFLNGLLAILIGHVIGCTLLYFAGLIGADRRMSSMESARISFGGKGSVVFSVLNVLQLIGWTARHDHRRGRRDRRDRKSGAPSQQQYTLVHRHRRADYPLDPRRHQKPR